LNSNGNYYFGNSHSGSDQWLSGKLDDIGIWSRALTDCEIKKLYYSPSFSVASSNQTICAGQNLTLTASGVPNYSWSNNANTASVVVNPTISTVYTITSTYTAGCYDSKTIAVTVNPGLNLTASTVSICKGKTATLTVSGATTYTWSTNANTPSIAVSPTVTTNYTVSGTSNGCTSTKTMQVLVNLCTGINDLQMLTELNIYPNPTGGEFMIQSDKDMWLEITDQLGRKVTELEIKTGRNNYVLPNLPKGVYILRGNVDAKFYSGKLVVQ
jgi:hypothetical protein